MRLNSKGFTLVEIIIVVAIIALLAAVAIPNMIRARMDANQTAAQASLKSFAVACETYASSSAALYPTTVDDLISGEPPFFSIDLRDFNDANNLRDGYYYEIGWGDNAYTVTARARPNTGDWDYQVTTGAYLQRSPRGLDSWGPY